MKKSLVSAVLVSSLLLTAVVTPSVAKADDIDSKIEQKNNTINDLKSKQAGAQSQIDSLQGEIDDIAAKAETILSKQTKLAKESEQLQKEIETLKVRIQKREVAIQDQARDVQVNGQSTNFIDAVVSAESVSDAIGRVQAMSTIVKANNDLVQQQKEDQKAVEDKKSENDKTINQLLDNAAELEQQKATTQQKQAELNVLKADYALQQNTAEGEKAGLEQQKAAAEAEAARVAAEQKQAEEAQKAAEEAAAKEAEQAAAQSEASQPATNTGGSGSTSSSTTNNTGSATTNNTGGSTNTGGGTVTPTPAPTPTPTPTPSVPAPSGGGVIGIAKSKIGSPYVYGAKGPNSFDCSGFTGWVYRQVGREIGGWTVPQESAGPHIPVSQAQAGDLLFWGSPGGTSHVAISLGGGSFIHAPSPGLGVQINSIGSWTQPSFAVRM